MPFPTERVARARRPGTLRRARCRSRRSPQDPDSGDAGQLPTLQRLLGRRRRHRRSRLRELRHPGGLRAARQARASTSKARSSSPATAAAGAASSRRWRGSTARSAASSTPIPRDDGYFQGDVYPDGRVPARAGRAARQRDGHADLSRRSADAGLGVRAAAARSSIAREAKTLLKIPVLPISYGDALPLLRSLQGPRRARSLARRAADHVSRRPRRGEGAPEAGVRLAGAAALQRHRADPGRAVSRRVDHPRQSSRCVGQRRVRSDQRQRRADGDGARPRGAAQERLEAEADDHDRVVGRRRVGPARIDRVGREAPGRSSRPRRSRTSTATAPAKAGCGMDGSHSLQAFVNEVARDVPDPRGSGKSVLEAQARRGS